VLSVCALVALGRAGCFAGQIDSSCGHHALSVPLIASSLVLFSVSALYSLTQTIRHSWGIVFGSSVGARPHLCASITHITLMVVIGVMMIAIESESGESIHGLLKTHGASVVFFVGGCAVVVLYWVAIVLSIIGRNPQSSRPLDESTNEATMKEGQS